MKLGIDAREIENGVCTGIGVMLTNFLTYFSRNDNVDTCVLFSREPLSLDLGHRVKNIVCKKMPTMIWDQVVLPWAAAKAKVDVFLSPYYKIPLFLRCARVSMIHDLMFLAYKGYRDELGWLRKLYYYTVGTLYARASDSIVTVSNYSKQDIITHYGIAEKKIAVVPNSISDEYFQHRGANVSETLFKNWGITTSYILYVGNFKPHKNIKCLIEAFAIVAQQIQDVQLVLAGDMATGADRLMPLIDTLFLKERVRFTGTVKNEDQLKMLYAGTRAFVFPSLYEGFGIPPVEAMACGAPVVSSRSTALEEVLGDAALSIDPLLASQMARAIKSVLTDDELCRTLIEKGKACAERYRLSIAGERFYGVLKQASRSRKMGSVSAAIMPRDQARLLVVMLGGIGNVVMLVPMLRTLREAYKKASITLMIGEPGAADILKGEGLVDETVLFDQNVRRSFIQSVRLIAAIRRQRFDCIIMASNTHALKGSILSMMLGGRYRIGEDIAHQGWFYTHKIPFRYPTHEIDGAAAIVKALGLNAVLKYPELNISCNEKEAILIYLRHHGIQDDAFLIGVHAGSGEVQKKIRRWPKERFARLADEIRDRYNATIVLTGGAREQGLVDEIAAMMEVTPLKTAGQLSIRLTAALIERCALFIGNDSGLMHIAAAVGTPSVVIWGPTNQAITAPHGEAVTIVRKDLACSPCYKNGKVACSELHCFTSISVNMVLDAVSRRLKQETIAGAL
ncbi:MAG: glycosyltransferase [Candidatus Omnitrophica bacterium]|nr:glycosyltransferase [Candidatus Omnitrophota bacterium]